MVLPHVGSMVLHAWSAASQFSCRRCTWSRSQRNCQLGGLLHGVVRAALLEAS